MPLASATLVYVANPTGPRTAAQLAAAMQTAALSFLTANLLSLLGVTLTSAIGSVAAGQAVLTIVLNVSSAVFQARWPSVEAGGANGPFPEHWTGNLRAAINQPVLASTPVYA